MDCAEGLVLLAEEVSGIVGSVLFQQPMSPSHLRALEHVWLLSLE